MITTLETDTLGMTVGEGRDTLPTDGVPVGTSDGKDAGTPAGMQVGDSNVVFGARLGATDGVKVGADGVSVGTDGVADGTPVGAVSTSRTRGPLGACIAESPASAGLKCPFTKMIKVLEV